MTLLAGQKQESGIIRDPDGRQVVTIDNSGGGGTGTAGAPAGATAIAASSGNQANANAVATLTGAAGKFTYITGFQLTGAGATAAGVVNATVAGVTGGPWTFTFAVPAGVTVGATPLVVTFPNPIPSSAASTSIVVTLPALGAGNTNAAASAQGFLL